MESAEAVLHDRELTCSCVSASVSLAGRRVSSEIDSWVSPAASIMRHLLQQVALLLLLALWPACVRCEDEEPSSPVCRMIPKNSLSFCSMVDYAAVVDEQDLDGSTFDATAKYYYENVNVVLQRFGCSAKYSLYTCDDCREAYKYWVCSVKFQPCGRFANPTDGIVEYSPELCSSTSSSSCIEGTTGRSRTCLSLCEDVVRKCPYVLNFQCPTVGSAFSVLPRSIL